MARDCSHCGSMFHYTHGCTETISLILRGQRAESLERQDLPRGQRQVCFAYDYHGDLAGHIWFYPCAIVSPQKYHATFRRSARKFPTIAAAIRWLTGKYIDRNETLVRARPGIITMQLVDTLMWHADYHPRTYDSRTPWGASGSYVYCPPSCLSGTDMLALAEHMLRFMEDGETNGNEVSDHESRLCTEFDRLMAIHMRNHPL